MTYTIVPPNSSATAAQELVDRVAELERAQRTEDVERMIALFDQDAVWVSGAGVRLIGLDRIASFTREVLPGAFAGDLSVRYDVEHIRFITTDVAVTSVNQEYLTADGRTLEPRQLGRPSYVWHRRGSEWRIATGQNTGVPVDGPD